MLVPDKNPDIITAREALARAVEAGKAEDYERANALTAIAQAHIDLARHESEVDAATDIIEHLTNISQALTAQIPI
jgi:hypothetical protein